MHQKKRRGLKCSKHDFEANSPFFGLKPSFLWSTICVEYEYAEKRFDSCSNPRFVSVRQVRFVFHLYNPPYALCRTHRLNDFFLFHISYLKEENVSSSSSSSHRWDRIIASILFASFTSDLLTVDWNFDFENRFCSSIKILFGLIFSIADLKQQ